MESPFLSEPVPGLRHRNGDTHLIREVMLTHQALVNVISRRVGVAPSRLALLRLFAVRNHESLGVMKIARLMGVNVAAISRQVKDLETLGYVRRSDDLRDHRRTSLQLTAEGQKAFEEVHERAHLLETALMSGATTAEIEIAAKILGLLRSVADGLD
jgi:DNA-binding MarR family transcriptional regulator